MRQRLTPYGRFLRRLFAGLPRRVILTLRYHGLRETLYRLVTFPLRMNPLRPTGVGEEIARWYRNHNRTVAVVIDAQTAPEAALAAARLVRRTSNGRVVLVAGDAEAAARLARARFVDEAVTGGTRAGLEAVGRYEDAVLLGAGTQLAPGWLELLQHAVYEGGGGDVGIAGSHVPGGIDFPPAPPPLPALCVSGDCAYIRREALDDLGAPDDELDYGLRAWRAGHRVLRAPVDGLVQPAPRPADASLHPRRDAAYDGRETRAPDGGVRIVYVTQDTGVGGGHRVVFGHLNGLLERGHHPELWTLAPDPPDWYDLRVPVRRFDSYRELRDALTPVDAVKVATWWETATPVWEASITHGVPVYHMQDIETSYYAERREHAVLQASYRPEFAFLAGSEWIRDQLRPFGIEATVLTPGVDLSVWRELPDAPPRAEDAILAVGRTNPLKNFPLTRAAYLDLPEPRPQLWLFGVEPQVGEGLGERASYAFRPSDAEVNALQNTTTVFLQTSRHEGFCLPPLEAMAAGAPVVCTDANSNREFCVDGVNCLMPAADPRAVREALEAVLGQPELRDRLRAEGRRTAAAYAWERKLEQSAAYFADLAERRAAGAPGLAARVS